MVGGQRNAHDDGILTAGRLASRLHNRLDGLHGHGENRFLRHGTDEDLSFSAWRRTLAFRHADDAHRFALRTGHDGARSEGLNRRLRTERRQRRRRWRGGQWQRWNVAIDYVAVGVGVDWRAVGGEELGGRSGR